MGLGPVSGKYQTRSIPSSVSCRFELSAGGCEFRMFANELNDQSSGNRARSCAQRRPPPETDPLPDADFFS